MTNNKGVISGNIQDYRKIKDIQGIVSMQTQFNVEVKEKKSRPTLQKVCGLLFPKTIP